MLSFGGRALYLAVESIDMRYGVPRLSSWIESRPDLRPQDGDLFIFLSKDCRRVKVMAWDVSGYWLCSKKLEGGRFARPVTTVGQSGRDTVTLSPAELGLLLEGISVHKATYSRHRPD